MMSIRSMINFISVLFLQDRILFKCVKFVGISFTLAMENYYLKFYYKPATHISNFAVMKVSKIKSVGTKFFLMYDFG